MLTLKSALLEVAAETASIMKRFVTSGAQRTRLEVLLLASFTTKETRVAPAPLTEAKTAHLEWFQSLNLLLLAISLAPSPPNM